MRHLHGKMTYANVMATVAVFIALGGAAYAAGLPKNSVGTKQIKNEAVTAAKVKKGSLTGAQVNASTLGTVPHAESAARAEGAAEAENSKLLQGHPASDFLGAGATAANSNQLGGLSASSYLGGPVVVRTKTEEGLTTGGGTVFVAAECSPGEVAVGGGFEESGGNAFASGRGFGATYQLRGSSPGLLVKSISKPGLTPAPASAGQTPTLWLIAYTFTGVVNNPEVTVYVDCVPNRGVD